ncbi:pilin [Sansalvadorimonas sp. 2012CJ34-2]|uniref:Pilin n=2 Tax=Parendozoicomonas callyspongiae TaxID=2942213 RepID=A0ABT0PDI8_9GAMM|nr:pilin [Sansalvadorimonas sp. 2012CJ34-2]
MRAEITEYYATHGEFPDSEITYLDKASPVVPYEVSRIKWWDGTPSRLEVWYGGNDASTRNGVILLTPTVNDGNIVWVCSNHNLASFAFASTAVLPANCR